MRDEALAGEATRIRVSPRYPGHMNLHPHVQAADRFAIIKRALELSDETPNRVDKIFRLPGAAPEACA